MNEVQALIDGLAARLRRPAGLDDRRFRSIAYSAHVDEIDPVRRASILGRQAPAAVTDWLEQLGVMQARGHLRVPANEAFGMVARVCFPVRFHSRLLGFLWLAEAGEPLTEQELVVCERSASDLAQALWRLYQQGHRERHVEAEQLRRLLAPQGLGSADATGIAAESCYGVLVVAVRAADDGPLPEGVDVRLAEAVDRLRRSVAPRHQLAESGARDAVVLVAVGAQEEVDERASALLSFVEEELDDVAQVDAVIGVGDAVAVLGELAASHEHARQAATIGLTLSDHGPLVRWRELGALRLLAALVRDRDPASLVPAPLRRLIAEPDGRQLVATLETYLDHAGDAAGAAKELFVHRSSLYNRLRKIEEIAGVDLRSGADRLELHLGLGLLRMSRGASSTRAAGGAH